MTRSGAETAVVISALVTGSLYAYRKLTEPAIASSAPARVRGGKVSQALGTSTPPVAVGKFAVGYSFAYMSLAFTAAVLPDLAGAMAILITTAVLIVQGEAVFTDIAEALS